jgi:hypothetical protein
MIRFNNQMWNGPTANLPSITEILNDTTYFEARLKRLMTGIRFRNPFQRFSHVNIKRVLNRLEKLRGLLHRRTR